MAVPLRIRVRGCLVLALLLAALAGLGYGGYRWLSGLGLTEPAPGQQRCVVNAAGRSVSLTLDQARLTTIVVGLSVRRGLPARAASIAMATVYQEFDIRNLDYGDRDSVGLFQQRPSQGWGTSEQLQDPYYATRKFYDALVKVRGWETGEINDVAQAVQRSGFPEAYRDHEADGRVLASAFTGNSPTGVSCLEREGVPGDPDGLASSAQRSLGEVPATVDATSVGYAAGDDRLAWAFAHHAVANGARYGVTQVRVADQVWTQDDRSLPTWTTSDTPLPDGDVQVTLRG